MTQKFTFNFETKQQLEIDVAGKEIIIPLDDETTKKQQLAIVDFRNNYGVLKDMTDGYDFDKTDAAFIDKVDAQQKKLVKDLVVGILGNEEYERCYELAGRNSRNLMPLAYFLVDLLSKETQRFADEAREKYLGNAKVQSTQ